MDDLRNNRTMYEMAIEHGKYRLALVFAIREYRRLNGGKLWADRIRGCWTRRNHGTDVP